ncbi:MAG: hypothetical protein JSU96_06415 [Acidobacteriota bacterium]|nr:MAG: hypothetical protein JSU96_06415 [Acidobacteriota bacterium]
MSEILKAIRYKSLDAARKALEQVAVDLDLNHVFDDDGDEPQGLLSIIPQDRLDEELFYQLFGTKDGVLIEVEKFAYSGYGPPADEHDYMGFVSENVAYAISGSRLPVEIEACSFGAVDFHHLDALVLDGVHPIDREDLAKRIGLADDWDFDRLFDLITEGQYTGAEIDELIHKGIQ